MFLKFRNYLIYSFIIAGLSSSGCGKKNSEEAPTNTWDGASDRNTSDLTLKDIEP
ncbi:MAG: hypothetical protein V4655_09110 [Bdellovibrionota bacterium]